MNKLLSNDMLSKNIDGVLLFVRVAIASLMLVHGLPKLDMLLSGDVQFASVFGLSPTLSLVLAIFAEVFCSVLLLFGFGTRLAVIPLIITMLTAVFYIHAADPFARQELGLLYLLVYVVLFVTGSGRYSLDHFVAKKQVSVSYQKQ